MEDLIKKALPLVDSETITKVAARLIDLGVIGDDDLQFVQDSDLNDLLRPIQLRKLLKFFESMEKANSLSDEIEVLIQNVSCVDPGATLKECSTTPIADSTVSLIEFIDKSSADPTFTYKDCPSTVSTARISEFLNAPNPEPTFSQKDCSGTQSVDLRDERMECSNKFTVTPEVKHEQNIEIPWKLFPEEVLKACALKTPIPKTLRSAMIRILVREVSKKNAYTGRKQHRALAQQFVSKYPETFQDRIGDIVVAGGYVSLMKCIEASFDNSRRKRFSDGDKPARKRKKSLQNSYGTLNWEPNDYPLGETRLSLAEKKEFLNQEYSKKKFDKEAVTDAMEKTYISQRHFINHEANSISDIKREWPFLLDEKYMLMHYEALMNQNVYKLFLDGIPVRGKQIYFFMKTKVSNLAIKMYVTEIEEAKQMLNSATPEAIGSFLLLMVYFKENIESLFRTFKNARSVTDFEAMNTKASPFIGVIGENFYLSKKYIVFLDGKATTFVDNFTAAISVMFAAFYNFNLNYPSEAALTLEFMQRCYAKINPERGSKVPTKKNSKYVQYPLPIRRLLEDLKQFESSIKL